MTVNKGIYNVQLVEKLNKILSKTRRLKVGEMKRVMGSKFFSARQLKDIAERVNYMIS